jgi:hypothetical protein
MKAKGNDQSQAFGTKVNQPGIDPGSPVHSMNASRKDSNALVLLIARIQNM